MVVSKKYFKKKSGWVFWFFY